MPQAAVLEAEDTALSSLTNKPLLAPTLPPTHSSPFPPRRPNPCRARLAAMMVAGQALPLQEPEVEVVVGGGEREEKEAGQVRMLAAAVTTHMPHHHHHYAPLLRCYLHLS